MFNDVLKHRSGRVIALARAVMAAVFLFAIWIDPGQPVQYAAHVYAALVAYLAAAAIVTVLTWNNWWLDAKLAAATHVVDIAVFTLLVFVTDGYTSPFFVFFVFLIFSAAIRWGWRETATTAAAVTLLYFGAGLLAGNVAEPAFDLQRFIIRSANLVILSGILIWFGINHGFSAAAFSAEEFLGDIPADDPPLERAVEAAARTTGATTAALLWRAAGASRWTAAWLADGEVITSDLGLPPPRVPRTSHLFDFPRNRALCRDSDRRIHFLRAKSIVDPKIGARFAIASGIALPIRTDAGQGLLLLGGIEALCTDHLEFGTSLGNAVSAHIQRHALLRAVKDSAGARARLSLARDLHDSIVQFLAGATFRIEAIKRSLAAGERPERELQALKELLLHEQQELRSAIGALRSDRISLPVLAADLKTLCGRLGKQWDIDCSLSAEVPEMKVPMRFHLDTHQLVREAVANAVRHATAKSVRVQLTADDSELRLDISNDGSGNPRIEKGSPWSLRERVDEANGTLMLASREDGTSVSITLPLSPEARP